MRGARPPPHFAIECHLEAPARRGFTHAHPTHKLLAFREVPAADKLGWLEEMRQFLDRFLTPERKLVLDRFRRGDL